jgi:hypothetical protein
MQLQPQFSPPSPSLPSLPPSLHLSLHPSLPPPQATGNTELIPWLTSYFYLYYPMLIVLVCIATIFSVGSRLASLCGYQKFIGEDDFSADYIDEGKTLMKRGEVEVMGA